MTLDEVLEVELVASPPSSSVTREFNMVFGATVAVAMVFLFISAFAGEAYMNVVVDDDTEQLASRPVWERYKLPYETDGEFGKALEVGPYELLQTDNEWNSTHHFVEYTLPLEEGGAAPNGLISLAVWRPNVPEVRWCPSSLKAVHTSKKPA